MTSAGNDPRAGAGAPKGAVFGGSIPDLYERYLVPLIFAPYAADLARELEARNPDAVLEIAAGTGVVTRAIAAQLPATSRIVATDLNAPMLVKAAAIGTARPVEWRACDAMQLPFADASFDAVVCQFGAMFFPDKTLAFAEARRVLRPGGVLMFNVWDRIDDNEFAYTVTAALGEMFADDPPRFLARTPHGYHDTASIARDVARAGFMLPRIDTVAHRSKAATAEIPAIAYCQGTPLRREIEARDAARLVEATALATRAIADQFGATDIEGKIQANLIVAQR